MKINNKQSRKSDVIQTLVYKVASATYHFTPGDKYVYLDFLDRNTSIKYKIRSKTGKGLINRMFKYGFVKETYTK